MEYLRSETGIMKRTATGMLGMVLAFSVSAVSVVAASACDRHFTDDDQDGLCDYCGTACQFADADEDGLCDGCGFDRHGMDTVCSNGYVDADEDGICDNCHVGRHACETVYTDTADNDTGSRANRGGHHGGHHRSGHGSHHSRSGRHCR